MRGTLLWIQSEVLIQTMKKNVHKLRCAVLAAGLLMGVRATRSQENGQKPSS
jgi:hypothetical protein